MQKLLTLFQQKISMYLPYFKIEILMSCQLTTSFSFEQLGSGVQVYVHINLVLGNQGSRDMCIQGEQFKTRLCDICACEPSGSKPKLTSSKSNNIL